MERKRVGLVQVYTGDGKGKTTAALGLALRATGQGLRVCILQFVKGRANCGEHVFSRRNQTFEIRQPNSASCFRQRDEALKTSARDALVQAKELLAGHGHDVVILDEVLTACHLGLISTEDVLELISLRPSDVELVLTGRGASPEVIEAADLVTEMHLVKHPYQKGIRARRGIEF